MRPLFTLFLATPLVWFGLTPNAPAFADGPRLDFSGDARFGVTYQGAVTKAANPYGLLRLNTHVSVVTDNGITFGAQIRMTARTSTAAVKASPRFYMSTGTPELAGQFSLPRRNEESHVPVRD